MKNDFTIARLGPTRLKSHLESHCFISNDAGVLVNASVHTGQSRTYSEIMEEAGPREDLFFQPESTHAAMITCGGLCPGLNDVIRALTMVLWYRYGVTRISGFRYGYEGLVSSYGHKPVSLTPDVVEDIHTDGGTILGSSRGPQRVDDMISFLIEQKIDILFTIGGDGTQRGALALAEEIMKQKQNISVIGVPKTIDNDILFTERTFGYETAVAMSQAPITCAHMEAKGVHNGIGLVKLMGRESGFVAASATLASSDVNMVLVPEVPFSLEKVLAFLETRIKAKAHAVIVVAEGAGQNLVPTAGTDTSGNKKLGDIGPFLKETISKHFDKLNIPVNVRYIDPSYIIRSAPATADDSAFCFQLASNAVHAAMSGRTAMIVGLWNGHFVHIPMEQAVKSRKKINPNGLLWQSVLDNTGQPSII